DLELAPGIWPADEAFGEEVRRHPPVDAVDGQVVPAVAIRGAGTVLDDAVGAGAEVADDRVAETGPGTKVDAVRRHVDRRAAEPSGAAVRSLEERIGNIPGEVCALHRDRNPSVAIGVDGLARHPDDGARVDASEDRARKARILTDTNAVRVADELVVAVLCGGVPQGGKGDAGSGDHDRCTGATLKEGPTGIEGLCVHVHTSPLRLPSS